MNNLPTKLYHYSGYPIEALTEDFHPYSFKARIIKGKPYGFWISVEDFPNDQTWETWCKAEDFRVEDLKYKYSVTLKSNANILYLSTAQEIREFGFKYKETNWIDLDSESINNLDWYKIKDLYDGIIIAPYNWECRMPCETSWYYDWDCASGCIWNLDMIELTLDSIREEISESQEGESAKDSQLECLVQLESSDHLEHKE